MFILGPVCDSSSLKAQHSGGWGGGGSVSSRPAFETPITHPGESEWKEDGGWRKTGKEMAPLSELWERSMSLQMPWF